jgi:hypothetical protein
VGERGVEAPAVPEGDHLRHPVGRGPRLARAARAAVGAQQRERMAPVLQQRDGVRQRPRSDLDVVPARVQRLDERAQDDGVGGVREVDPDAHGAGV